MAKAKTQAKKQAEKEDAAVVEEKKEVGAAFAEPAETVAPEAPETEPDKVAETAESDSEKPDNIPFPSDGIKKNVPPLDEMSEAEYAEFEAKRKAAAQEDLQNRIHEKAEQIANADYGVNPWRAIFANPVSGMSVDAMEVPGGVIMGSMYGQCFIPGCGLREIPNGKPGLHNIIKK